MLGKTANWVRNVRAARGKARQGKAAAWSPRGCRSRRDRQHHAGTDLAPLPRAGSGTTAGSPSALMAMVMRRPRTISATSVRVVPLPAWKGTSVKTGLTMSEWVSWNSPQAHNSDCLVMSPASPSDGRHRRRPQQRRPDPLDVGSHQRGWLSGRVNRCQRHGASELFLSADSRGRTLPGGYRVPRCRECRAEADALAAEIVLSGKRGDPVESALQHRCTPGWAAPACFYGP